MGDFSFSRTWLKFCFPFLSLGTSSGFSAWFHPLTGVNQLLSGLGVCKNHLEGLAQVCPPPPSRFCGVGLVGRPRTCISPELPAGAKAAGSGTTLRTTGTIHRFSKETDPLEHLPNTPFKFFGPY